MLRVSRNPCRQMLLSLDGFGVVVGGRKKLWWWLEVGSWKGNLWWDGRVGWES